jgi:hypothetical protein
LAQLDLAASSRFASGTSIEVLLELLAVRARISVDATIASLIALEDRTGLIDAAVICRLAAFLKIEGPETNLRIAKELAKRTRETSEAFYRYAGTWGSHHPYFTFSSYMMAWGSIIASRLPSSEDTQRQHLREARHHLESARRHMYEGEYCMHFFEVGNVLRAVRRALRAPGTDPAPRRNGRLRS